MYKVQICLMKMSRETNSKLLRMKNNLFIHTLTLVFYIQKSWKILIHFSLFQHFCQAQTLKLLPHTYNTYSTTKIEFQV